MAKISLDETFVENSLIGGIIVEDSLIGGNTLIEDKKCPLVPPKYCLRLTKARKQFHGKIVHRACRVLFVARQNFYTQGSQAAASVCPFGRRRQ